MGIDFSAPFTLEGLFTLGMLVLLQAVLGFDNLLYISLESKRVREDKQSFVRKTGIGLAIILRIVLLFVLLIAIGKLQTPFFEYGLEPVAAQVEHHDHDHSGDENTVALSDHGNPDTEHEDESSASHHILRTPNKDGGYIACSFNVHSLITLLGGIFIIYTAFKEITHLLAVHDLEGHHDKGRQRGVATTIFWIVLMNLVFSFDSILSAIALTHNVWVMSLAIISSGVLMILLADTVSEFLKKNRMYEVLGLFILLIVGVMLVSEGGHLAHLHLCGRPVVPMAKSTFYFVIAIMVAVDVIQTRYQRKLLAQRAHEAEGHA
jgi:predicted tellurium resistance membrane protein TerC